MLCVKKIIFIFQQFSAKTKTKKIQTLSPTQDKAVTAIVIIAPAMTWCHHHVLRTYKVD